MQFDPNNKVVQLCAKGMEAEAQGNIEEAKQLFEEAWNSATNDFEAFTAAHYMARNQPDLQDVLKWNLESLHRANQIKDEGMKGHYPSLYLNVASSYEKLGDTDKAKEYYQLAAGSCEDLPAGKYTDIIKGGVAEGLKRVGIQPFNNRAVAKLINQWCERRDLKPLSIILPAYVGNLGIEADRNKLISAFSFLAATRCLNGEEQKLIEQVVSELTTFQV